MEYNKLVHEHTSAKKTVVVNWCMTDVCNFKCSYCTEYLHGGYHGWPDFESVIKFCDQVINHYSPKDIYFEFTGGEITYWLHFPDLLKFLKSYNSNIFTGVISNGSRSLLWWDKNKDYLDHACLSFHPEYSKPDHYINVVKQISCHMRTHVNFMMHPDKKLFQRCIKMVENLSNSVLNISIALQPLLIDFGDQLYDYTKEQLEIIDKQYELYGSKVQWNIDWPIFRGAMKMINGKKELTSSAHRFIADKTNKWKGWKCYAGVEQIVVDIDGNVWRGWCKEGDLIGSINDIFDLPTSPIICDRDFCHCNFDIMCTKEKI